MSKPKKNGFWTYAAATRTLPYVRLILGSVRQQFITIWHLYRVAGYRLDHPEYCDQIRFLAVEGKEAMNELARMEVIPYESPLRGIALFSFFVREGKDRMRGAYYVYKDTRDSIETYIFKHDLCSRNDLYHDERLVPAAWKEAGAILRLIEGTTP